MTGRDFAILAVGADLGALLIVVLDAVTRRQGRGDTSWGGKRV